MERNVNGIKFRTVSKEFDVYFDMALVMLDEIMKNNEKKNKHMTLDDRIEIQECLSTKKQGFLRSSFCRTLFRLFWSLFLLFFSILQIYITKS